MHECDGGGRGLRREQAQQQQRAEINIYYDLITSGPQFREMAMTLRPSMAWPFPGIRIRLKKSHYCYLKENRCKIQQKYF